MSDFRFRFVCRSDSMVENTGTLIGLDGTVITTGSVFTIAHPQLGELRAENIPPQYILTASDQGVYTCRIPLQSGETRDIHVGIYPSGFNSKYFILWDLHCSYRRVAKLKLLICHFCCFICATPCTLSLYTMLSCMVGSKRVLGLL